MTLQMLEYFIALVEKGSFTDAANACYVSQPALSRAIANLEKELGCAVVERGKTVVATAAGEVLRIEAERILGLIDVMVERVQRAKQGYRGTMVLGYVAYGMLRAFRQNSAAALDAFKEEGFWMETVYDSTPEIKKRLISGELDAVILPEICTWDLPRCFTKPVYRQKNMVMIPRGHLCFESKKVSMEQLRESKFVFFSPDDMPMVLSKHVNMCRDAGFSPDIVGYGRKIGDVVDLVHQYGAVSIMTDAFDYAESDDLRLVEIEDMRSSMLVLAARKDCVNPAVQWLFENLGDL